MSHNVTECTICEEALKTRCFSAAQDILLECTAIVDRLDKEANTASPNNLSGCGSQILCLMQRQARWLVLMARSFTGKEAQSLTSDDDRTLLLERLDDIISSSYSRFYAYLFKDLPFCWRQLYTDASILKFCALVLLSDEEANREVDGGGQRGGFAVTNEMIRTLDLTLILAGAAGAERGRRWVDETFAMLEDVDTSKPLLFEDGWLEAENEERKPKRRRIFLDSDKRTEVAVFCTREILTPPVQNPVRRTNARDMDMASFQAYLDRSSPHQGGPKPLVITGLTDEWPARTTHPWNQPAYLLSRTLGGRRLVPVEIGRSYVDEGWGQRIMKFGDFLHEYIEAQVPGQEKVGYLAQHQLFTQLPSLRNDILVPDLCFTEPPPHPTADSLLLSEADAFEEPQLNAWFGPGGTITPLHTDPYHNLLAQIVGRKYVRLYAPQVSELMRARSKEDGVEMANTSLVDVGVVEGWDAPLPRSESDAEQRLGSWQEEFRRVPFVDCILEPGDTLYIPTGWWHYVRGLSVSFSLSFWWR